MSPFTRVTIGLAACLISGFCLLFAGCASQDTGGPVLSRYERPARTLTEKMSDKIISTRVSAKLDADELVDSDAVDVAVIRGMVYLTGTVDSSSTARMAADIARGVDGVVGVENGLTVDPY